MTDPADAKKMAHYWHKQWREALEAKDFARAEECFHSAVQWKLRANVTGMMGQEFNGGKSNE